MPSRFDPSRLRRDFPILSSRVHGQPLVYLDNAATTQKPRAVIDAISQYYKRYNANVHRAAHALSAQATTAFEQVRRDLAEWTGAASPDELIWTRGTTEAINLIAQSYLRPRLKAGDRLLLMECSHHANIVPWQMVAEACGAQIDVLPCTEGEVDLKLFARLLDRQPRLAALTHASNALGSVFPIEQMCALARAAGVPTLVDGAQALPHFDIDLSGLGCDFYAFSGHKLFGPTGIGALWARIEILEAMPPWQGGGEMIEQVSFAGTRYAGLPFRFEAGTPDISGVIGLGAAIEYLRSQDRQALERHEQQLLQHALECCATLPGFRALKAGAERVSLISFLIDGLHPQDVALWLDQQGIAVRAGHHCAMPLMSALGIPGSVRASFAFYNTLDEVEKLAQALDQLISSQRGQISLPQAISADQAQLDQIHQAKGWNERYQALMALGASLPELPQEWRRDDYRLHGCESRVWLINTLDDSGRLACRADADGRILRALLALLLESVNGLTPDEVLALDLPDKIARLDLQRHLSPTRGNGLNAMIDALLQFAHDNRTTG
ncbi:SufS family cysteine desulfurase [Marinobacterium sp. D7]|uniref:SufS family cysteine desulfurase n=1 Tax=Marinobacterium ramblicola TaxID=2849041 RepID=UPI001C2D5DF8|nr:SufS family cysteine desulfurase [Marinobacterium ramblicola]MBV1787948.1 SufS family cysteine desulfurase [Marinobacterium ramblicola]